MSLFVNLLALAVPVFTLQVYDRVIASAGISTLWGLAIGMIFVIIFDYILRMARSRIMQSVALRVDVLVGQRLFDKLMGLPLHMLESKPVNHWQSLFRDVDVVRTRLPAPRRCWWRTCRSRSCFWASFWSSCKRTRIILARKKARFRSFPACRPLSTFIQASGHGLPDQTHPETPPRSIQGALIDDFGGMNLTSLLFIYRIAT